MITRISWTVVEGGGGGASSASMDLDGGGGDGGTGGVVGRLRVIPIGSLGASIKFAFMLVGPPR